MAARITIKSANDELARLGHQARLEKASEYFYFWTGEAADWIDRTVRVAKIRALTFEQWIAEFKRLKKVNQEIVGAAKPPCIARCNIALAWLRAMKALLASFQQTSSYPQPAYQPLLPIRILVFDWAGRIPGREHGR